MSVELHTSEMWEYIHEVVPEAYCAEVMDPGPRYLTWYVWDPVTRQNMVEGASSREVAVAEAYRYLREMHGFMEEVEELATEDGVGAIDNGTVSSQDKPRPRLACNGRGRLRPWTRTCNICDGTGVTTDARWQMSSSTTKVQGTPPVKEYVAGFLFSKNRDLVLLIKKNRGPSSVVGKWNALGGKVEVGETPEEAMHREFIEEAGQSGKDVTWSRFLELKGEGWQVTFFHAFDDAALEGAYTAEDEQVSPFVLGRRDCLRCAVDMMSQGHHINCITTVPNLSWIIPMALGHRDDNVQVYEVTEKVPWQG